MTENPESFVRLAFEGGTAWKALKTALVVGFVLIIINQYDTFIGDIAFSWVKAFLCLVVPYCVSTLGAVGAKREQLRSS